MKIDDFIDIEEDDQPIDQEKLNFELTTLVPHWPHRYIYALSDLDYANKQQKEFYYKFRDTFFQGKCLDVLGNNNYYFLLLFDLLEQYEKHKNLQRLEEYLDRLAAAYPRTKGYGRRFLLEKMYSANYTEGITRLERRMVEENTYLSWDWKGRYKDKLNLGKKEMDILEKIYLSSNNFVSIAFCGTELVKLYINTAKKLEDAYHAKRLKKSEEFHAILDLIARKEYRFHLNSSNYNYHIKNGENALYEYLVKYCEQLLRKKYQFKKLSGFDKHYSHPMVNEAIREHMLTHIEEYIPELLDNAAMPDEQTEMALNVLHTTRWKTILNLDESYYKQVGTNEYLRNAEHLILFNKSNPSLENILLELAKFLSNLGKQKSIEYFLRYIDQNLKQRTLTLKDMSKAMAKKLFSSPESHIKFLKVMTSLLKREQTLESALEEIKGFYEPVRKKISLDINSIKKIQHDFSATADVLSVLLSDEEEPVKTESSAIARVTTTTIGIAHQSAYQIDFSGIEVQLLQLFQNRTFSLGQAEIDSFCQSMGASTGVLVNNINEQSYELLDDLLIEKQADTYTINSEYYKQIEKI
ncbi:tellurite resistance TerB C-terminal domain-containing protein [Pedobacter miscanthi]|uniref:tellurite resistance TerB C-terminal domain-containing protein n=1 Tax=Pedobacter miscanthi TaxID=2259170 RepID=UPI00292FC2F9|nr:tellurite resistance TerB C-terminal domain-containing protein [Pedobacter miscanthi]